MKTAIILATATVQAEFITFEGGPVFDITWDAAKDGGRIKFQADNVAANNWLGIVFPADASADGAPANNRDWVVFQGIGNYGEIHDLYQKPAVDGVEQLPVRDNNENLENNQRRRNGDINTYTFTTWRKLKTDNSGEQDKTLECGQTYDMQWATTKDSTSADVALGWQSDKFKMEIFANCTIVLSGAVYKAIGLVSAVAVSLYL